MAGLILAGCLLPSSSFFWLEMNLALLHDRRLVQTFWEEKISSRSRNEEDEEQRLERSALTRWEPAAQGSQPVSQNQPLKAQNQSARTSHSGLTTSQNVWRSNRSKETSTFYCP